MIHISAIGNLQVYLEDDKYDYIMYSRFAIYIQIEILAMGNQEKCVCGLSSLFMDVPNVLRKCPSLF